jgi:hypothetical protein
MGPCTQELNDVFLEIKQFNLDILLQDESTTQQVVITGSKNKVLEVGEQVQKRP